MARNSFTPIYYEHVQVGMVQSKKLISSTEMAMLISFFLLLLLLNEYTLDNIIYFFRNLACINIVIQH